MKRTIEHHNFNIKYTPKCSTKSKLENCPEPATKKIDGYALCDKCFKTLEYIKNNPKKQ